MASPKSLIFSMEKIFTGLLEKAPEIAALIVVVFMFLKNSDKQTQATQREQQQRDAAQAVREKSQAEREENLTKFLGALLSELGKVIKDSAKEQTQAITRVTEEVSSMRREFAAHDTFMRATLHSETTKRQNGQQGRND